MMPLYFCGTESAVALAAATAKTVVGVKAHANSGLYVAEYKISFDGVTASAVPVLVEFCYATFATNSPGTNSTSTTPRQLGGRSLTAGFTAAKNWSAEPTVLTVIEEHLLTPNGGLYVYQYPLGYEPDAALAEGFALRLTAPAIVNCRGGIKVGRC